MEAQEQSAISTDLHPPKVWKPFVDDIYYILKQKLVPSHQQSWKKMEEENNRELAFFHTLLKSNNGKISVLVYSKPMHTDPYLHYSSHHQTSCERRMDITSHKIF